MPTINNKGDADRFPNLQTVHVRVNDAATGQPTAVRVRVTDTAGTYYAPLGRLTDFATEPHQDVGGNVRLGARSWAYVPGAFEIQLPPGAIQVAIHKGPEYRPLTQTIQLKPGRLALRFTIERWLDLPAQGWYSGDGRAHSLSPHAALLEAQAEDVRVVNLLAGPTKCGEAAGKKTALADLLAFSGQAPALEAPGSVVVVNTHNVHPVLGSLGLLNCHRVVYPITFGGPDGEDDWTLADWCDQCHRKKGLVVWTRVSQQAAASFLGEALIDLLLGKIDALEVDSRRAGFQPAHAASGWQPASHAALALWYDLLDAGVKVPLVGSSAKDSNTSPLGAIRTYAHLQPNEEFCYRAWIEAVRAGRTFITNGPALLFTVNGQSPGALLRLNRSGENARIQAEVLSQEPIGQLELVLNGNVILATDKTTLEAELPLHEAGWMAARCWGATQSPGLLVDRVLFAHTSPVYLILGDAPSRTNRESVERLLVHVDAMETWTRQEARCDDRERDRFLALTTAARGVLEKKR